MPPAAVQEELEEWKQLQIPGWVCNINYAQGGWLVRAENSFTSLSISFHRRTRFCISTAKMVHLTYSFISEFTIIRFYGVVQMKLWIFGN